MVRNYFKTAFRILLRNKFYSFINIAGMGIGLAACILIILYIKYELSYDHFNKNADRIFIVTEQTKANATDYQAFATTPRQLAPLLKSTLPDVKDAARLVQMSHYNSIYTDVQVSNESKQFYEQNLYYTDPSFFKIFSLNLLKGNAKQGLSEPYTIFISSSIAKKYFGEDDPIGKVLTIGNSQNYDITGVYQDFPANSHIHADFLASFSSIETPGAKKADWYPEVYTYLLLKNKADAKETTNKLTIISKEYMPAGKDERVSLNLMPLLDIHLHSNLRFLAEPQSDIRYIYLFTGIALLILFIACFNYVNMAIGQSSERLLEMGLRKVLGASRPQLIKQYYLESFLLTFFATALGFGLACLLLPYFNELTQLQISLKSINALSIIGFLLSIILIVSFLAGGYPALLLSSFRPVPALKGKIIFRSGVGLRKVLVVSQFVISIVLIICVIVLQKQMNYIHNHIPGATGSQVILIKNRGVLEKKYTSFKSELLKSSNIQAVTTTQFIPGFVHDTQTFDPGDIEGYDQKISIPDFYGGESFIKTFGLNIIKGRDFSNDYATDPDQSVLVNQEAVNQFGWVNPVGKNINFKIAEISGGKLQFHKASKKVIGVVKDFNYESLKKRISPIIIEMTKAPLLYIAVRTKTDHLDQTLSFMKNKWQSFVPDHPFDYSFLQNDFEAMYHLDYLLNNLFKGFALLAIIIACLGLSGLSVYTVERRSKEIGIRKVFGASVVQLTTLLSKDFIKLVLIAIVIASPIAWWAMHKWLQNFAYRIHISWWIFLFAGFIAILIALITVSFQAIKAAIANPVESLRSE